MGGVAGGAAEVRENFAMKRTPTAALHPAAAIEGRTTTETLLIPDSNGILEHIV